MAAHHLLRPRAPTIFDQTRNLSDLVEAIISLLNTLNPQNPRPQCFVSCPLNQFSPYLSPGLVNEVINRQTNPKRALFFFNWASNPSPNPQNYSHSRSCYAAITDLLLSRSLFSVAASILEKSGNFSDFFVSRFVKASGDRGNLKGAVFWFHRAKSIGDGNCLYSYNALLGVLVRANKMSLARSIFNQMLNDGIVKPDVSAYTTMIRGFCKVGMLNDARKLFDEMPVRPNPIAFNTIINGYCKKGDMENAKSLFSLMASGDKDCLPDIVTYSTMVDGYCKIGEFDEAMGYMGEMMKIGHEPNIVTFNAIIYALCLRGKVDEAKRMMTEMRLNGVKENLATHTSILRGFCFARRSDEAFQYFKQMGNSNTSLDAKCYELIVREYCKVKKPDKALSLIAEMRKKKMNLKVSSFNSVISVLVARNDLNLAMSILKGMPEMGCPPNFVTFNTVISSLCRMRGMMAQAQELVLEMRRKGVNLDACLYGELVKGYYRDGNRTKAEEVLREAIVEGYIIDDDSFLAKVCLEMQTKAGWAKTIF